MKPTNEMKLAFESRSQNESFARVAVAAFIAQLDPTVEEISDIKTAVSEAVTNCVVHGYKDCIGKIYITAKIYPDNRVRIIIRDAGCGDVYKRQPGHRLRHHLLLGGPDDLQLHRADGGGPL